METNFNGYQTNFISNNNIVNFPTLSDKLLLVIAPVRNSEEDILKYQNYSVVQHAERRLPIFTASNIDGKKFQKVSRKTLFNGKGDRWKKDKRISYKHQWGNQLYSAAKSDFDKGHMTKREDVQWGDTIEEIVNGAESTFYFTNSVPQRKEVNRAIWLKIEDDVLHDSASSNELKINVFTGPVLSDEDPIFVTPIKEEDVKLPTLFWKVIYYLTIDNQLARVAFLVGQKHILEREEIVSKARSTTKGEELFMDFKQAETYQVEVNLIEKLTEMIFPPALDVFQEDRPSPLVLEEVQVRGVDAESIEQNIYGLFL